MDAPTDARTPSDLEWEERKTGAQTQYTLSPSRMNALPVLVGAGVWDSFLVFFVIAINRAPGGAHGPLLVVPIAHGIAGVAFTWLALVKTLNRTRFTIDRDAVVLDHTPIWARGARFATRDVDRFELSDGKEHRRFGQLGWRVHVMAKSASASAKGGTSADLWLPIDTRDHADFVVRRLNAALGEARS